jgi:hypothetical protein
VKKKQSDPHLSTWKNRDFVTKIIFQAMAIAATLLFIVFTSSAVAQQVEIKDAPLLPKPPKISSFAPANDLVDQVQKYIEELEVTLESEQEYKDTEGKVGRCSSTLAVIALCLGLHDEDNKFKTNAPALIKAARDLAATTDYQSAKKAFQVVKDAADGKVKTQAELKWEPVASLPDLMKQVPNVNTKLKMNVKGTRFKSKAKDTAGYTATIAAIGQGTIADISKAKNADEVKKWYGYMSFMRDSAGEAGAAIRRGDQPGTLDAMKNLTQSCDDCHKAFHPAALLVEEAATE